MTSWLTPTAYLTIILLGLCLLTSLLWLVLAATEGRRLTVRGWLGLAWLATLIMPALAEGAVVLIYSVLQSFASSVEYQAALYQQRGVAQIAVPIVVFLLTMACIAWLTGRMVLRPLAAMDEAAHSIAGGNLEIAVPAPPLREVAEVAEAFRAMSDALRDSIERQAELEQERRLFVSAIAHDLRTPLFSLRGYLEGLERDIANTPEKRATYLRICQDQANTLERMVGDLFTYAQLEYLAQEPVREPLELGEVVRAVIEATRLRAEAKQITLMLAPSRRRCPVAADRHLLERAVRNVLDNALRYTPAGGTVRVCWWDEGSTCVFAVCDTGPGFAPDDLPHLFSPLYRGDTSRNSQTGGAGLGLAIARRIMLAHGGDLIAANAHDGGAEVTGRLTLAERCHEAVDAVPLVIEDAARAE